ncbi:MAG: gene transfer agent family protein [Phyllobacteriaceae bacterium]|nr:gene transfer agent family protein [Phyllobacteriaceae bacterium]
MAVNRRRGEIEAELDGAPRRLVLTLGALAELEDAVHADDLGKLVERFASGRLAARDIVRVVGAGLRAAGGAESDNDVAAMTTADGAAGFARIVAELLSATFGEAKP